MNLLKTKRIEIGCYPIGWWLYCYGIGAADMFSKWIDDNADFFEEPTKRYNFGFVYVDIKISNPQVIGVKNNSDSGYGID